LINSTSVGEAKNPWKMVKVVEAHPWHEIKTKNRKENKL